MRHRFGTDILRLSLIGLLAPGGVSALRLPGRLTKGLPGGAPRLLSVKGIAGLAEGVVAGKSILRGSERRTAIRAEAGVVLRDLGMAGGAGSHHNVLFFILVG